MGPFSSWPILCSIRGAGTPPPPPTNPPHLIKNKGVNSLSSDCSRKVEEGVQPLQPPLAASLPLPPLPPLPPPTATRPPSCTGQPAPTIPRPPPCASRPTQADPRPPSALAAHAPGAPRPLPSLSDPALAAMCRPIPCRSHAPVALAQTAMCRSPFVSSLVPSALHRPPRALYPMPLALRYLPYAERPCRPVSCQLPTLPHSRRLHRTRYPYLTCRFRASLKHKDDGQKKFIKPNSQRQDIIIKYWVSIRSIHREQG